MSQQGVAPVALNAVMEFTMEQFILSLAQYNMQGCQS